MDSFLSAFLPFAIHFDHPPCSLYTLLPQVIAGIAEVAGMLPFVDDNTVCLVTAISPTFSVGS